MKNLINEILLKFGGREPGSINELKAQKYIYRLLLKFTPYTYLHYFNNPLKAKFCSLKIFAFINLLALIFYFIYPFASFLLTGINLFLFMGHFVLYKNWLDFLFKKEKSSNVFSSLKPNGKISKRIIVSGHIDSTREFFWFYKLKTFGMVIFIISGITLLISFLITFSISFFSINSVKVYIFFALWSIFSLSHISYWKVYSNIVVDGAYDNLSGLALAYYIFESFVSKEYGKSNLKNTELVFISFGSEEAGLKGSEQFLNTQKSFLTNSININFDTIKDRNNIQINKGELMTVAFFDKTIVQKVSSFFELNKIKFSNSLMTVGATDSSSFHKYGLKTVSIIALDTSKLDPIYHTRLDTLTDNFDEELLFNIKNAIVDFIIDFDSDN